MYSELGANVRRSSSSSGRRPGVAVLLFYFLFDNNAFASCSLVSIWLFNCRAPRTDGTVVCCLLYSYDRQARIIHLF